MMSHNIIAMNQGPASVLGLAQVADPESQHKSVFGLELNRDKCGPLSSLEMMPLYRSVTKERMTPDNYGYKGCSIAGMTSVIKVLFLKFFSGT